MSIKKVAKLANVSTATVSRVINHSRKVNPETAKRVRRAMSKIGYVPKPLLSRPGPRQSAYKKSNLRSGIVAFVVCMRPSVLADSPVMASILQGAEEALIQRGLSLVQVYVKEGNPAPPVFSKNNIDGALIIGPVPDSIETVLSQYASVILTSEHVSNCDFVGCDNEAIGNLAFNYLKERRHRHVAFFSLNKDHVAGNTRQQAFCKAAQRSQIKVNVFESLKKWDDKFLKNPQLMEAMCRPVVEEMLKLPNMPTGIFVAVDSFTAILYPVLKSFGIVPGKDVDIISCNNETMLLAGLSPRPASIDIKAEYIGQRGVEQLCWRMEHLDDPTTYEIKVKPKLAI